MSHNRPWIAPDLQALLAQLNDDAILALTLFGEARSEPIEGQVAVGSVIANRASDSKQRWGTSIRGVCLQPFQFSCWNVIGGDKNYARLFAMAKALATNSPEMKHPAMEQCAWTSLGISRRALMDRVKGANHYHTSALTPRPAWAQKHTPVIQVHRHVFYVL